ncbi:MAG TPA: hypothetical protein VFY91_02090 [Microbacterium sp.]|nr:hypothetical protein [Microbacterium sp.]
MKDTAKAEAGHVAETAKVEAKTVATEAKNQAKTLYAQTKNELRDQAGVQQQKAAAGLRAMGDELRSLAAGEKPQNSGLASDLVQQASTRISSAASWIGDRDPAELLDEVKAYARRKPGLFIGLAAVAGVVAGRLTRALTEHNAEEKAEKERLSAGRGVAGGTALPPTSYAGVAGEPTYPATYPVAGTDDLTETPLYAERSASLSGGLAEEEGDSYVRRDTL